MKKDKTDKAIAYAHRLLNIRPRSEHELRDRLFRKGFSRTATQNTISLLKDSSIIDDVRFARLWIDSRMQTNPKGSLQLRRELQAKGVASSVIDRVLSEEGREKDGSVIRKLAERKKEELRRVPDVAARKKLFAYLARRGFTFDSIEDVLRELFG